MVVALVTAPVFAADAVPAGTAIVNVAVATGQTGDTPIRVSSNPATLVLAEILDVSLSGAATDLQAGQDGVVAVPFTLTNTGNGREAFVVDGHGDGGTETVKGFAVDRDGDGRFDPAVDAAIPAGGATPVMDHGTAAPMLALVSGASSGSDQLVVAAHAVTGSGQPGTVFPGQGDGGGDAVVGRSMASDEVTLVFNVTANGGEPGVSLNKSQQVLDPDGGSSPVKGATITYTVQARFDGAAPAKAARLTDPVPTGTRFVPGSLTLDGAVLTDAPDDDPGRCDGALVDVALGDVVTAAVHTLQFQVTIQ